MHAAARKLPRPFIAAAIALAAIGTPGCTTAPASSDQPAAPAPTANSAPAPDSTELRAMFEADQADRQTLEPADWEKVSQRDEAREKRVREMLADGSVRTPADYYHAAMICQHSDSVEGIELAHELAMISAALGSKNARWLMAASYDRLLHRLKQPQRFGTQYAQQGNEPMSLVEVSPGVTDSMRKSLNVPTLERAKAREAEFRKNAPQH